MHNFYHKGTRRRHKEHNTIVAIANLVSFVVKYRLLAEAATAGRPEGER